MKSSKLYSIFFFVYTITLSIGSIICKDNNNNLITNQAALFVFGDSLFDPGNNIYIDTLSRYKSNLWPYGRTTFKFPTGRISDGRLILDFIAEYAWLPLIPPNLQPSNGKNQFTYGVNFASGGAGALVESFSGWVINLETQINNFKKVEMRLRSELGDSEAKRVFSRAVYLFQIGANDYIYRLLGNTSASSAFQSLSKQKFFDIVVGNMTTAIEEVYKIGGRKFGFLNLGAYDCAPASLVLNQTNIGSCYKPLTELINFHNERFPNVLRRLERNLSGFKYALHDYHTSFSERINNPSKYGFKYGDRACCGSGPLRGINTCGNRVLEPPQDYELCENVTDYIFFDSSHMTEKAHQQFAELIWNGTSDVTGPYNLKTLFQMN